MTNDAPREGDPSGTAGDPYLEWILGAGLKSYAMQLPDRDIEGSWIPVLIAFDRATTTLDDIREGSLGFESSERRGEWKENIHIPEFFFDFNEVSRELQDRRAEHGLLEEMELVMAFANRRLLTLYQSESHDVDKGERSAFRSRIRDLFAGPALQPFDAKVPPEFDDEDEKVDAPDPKDGDADGPPTDRNATPRSGSDRDGEEAADRPARRRPLGDAGTDTLSRNLPWGRIDRNIRRILETSEIGPHLVHDPARPAPVVTAVIDDGIAFANARFREGTRTAFRYVWIQSVPYGRDLWRRLINRLLKKSVSAGAVDEEALYRDRRILDFGQPHRNALGHAVTHGTPVCDLAMGRRPDDDGETRDRRFMMAVQLPTELVGDTSLSRLHPFIFAAVIYLVLRMVCVTLRQRRSDPTFTLRPMVINISFGNTAGPHDGMSAFERAIDTLLTRWSAIAAPLSIVLAAGNSHLTRGHAVATLCRAAGGEGSRVVLPWRVQPDDRTDSSMEIWLPPVPPGVTKRVRVTVLPPGAAVGNAGSGWLTEPHRDPGQSDTPTIADADGHAVCAVYHRVNPYSGRPVFTIFLQPTARLDARPDGAPDGPVAPSGLWRVVVETHPDATDDAAIRIDAWIQRDDTPFNHRRLGRQSYFDDPADAVYDEGGHPIEVDDAGALVRRAGNMSAIATGCRPVVVGGLIDRTGRPARYSAGGPVLTPDCADQPPRTGPDVAAISDDTAIHRGVLAAATYGGSVAAINGTSVAAPQVTRRLAEIAAKGTPPDRTAAQAAATPLPGAPPERVGTGRITVPGPYPRRTFD